MLEATLRGARGPHVRLKRGLDDTNKSPTSPAAPPEFHTFLAAVGRPARLKRSVVLWVKEAERHEAFLDRAVVKGHRHGLVAAGSLKLRAA